MTNIIQANLSKSRFYRTAPVYQYNYGMVLQITGIQLPVSYQVDYANDMTGNSIPQIGDSTGCPIPAQFFQPGATIYAWLRVHPTEDSGITVATIVIPISPRAVITSEEPTPVEQSAIDEAIAALNSAVEHVDDAVEHYPKIENGVWCVWDVDNGAYVSTGINANGPQGETGATGASGQDGTTFTPTVASNGDLSWSNTDGKPNPATVNIKGPQGETGQTGATGQTGPAGADGFSPSIAVSETAGGHRVTVTNKTGSDSFDVLNGTDGTDGAPGLDGQDGYSPTASVSKSGGTATITITDKNGTTSVQVSDGTNGTNGTNGTDGTTFTPSVANNGDLSWSNDGGKTNPATVNIMGPAGASGEMIVENVTGSTPSITGVNNHRYICGEVSTLTVTAPASGCIDVVFDSGSTATVLTVTPPNGYTKEWANDFDPDNLDANTTYEINIMMVGTKCLGVACAWT